MFVLLLIVVYLYVLWRRLRDNYQEDKLITFGWLSTLVFVVGSRLTFGLSNWGVFETGDQWWQIHNIPGMVFGGGVLSVSLLSWYITTKNNWKMWSFVEDLLPLGYLVLFVLGLDQWWFLKNVRVLVEALTMLLGFCLTLYFNSRYRSYSWYLSGKKGFSVGATCAVVFLILIIETIVFGKGYPLLIIYSLISLLSIAQLVILGDIWHKK